MTIEVPAPVGLCGDHLAVELAAAGFPDVTVIAAVAEDGQDVVRLVGLADDVDLDAVTAVVAAHVGAPEAGATFEDTVRAAASDLIAVALADADDFAAFKAAFQVTP